MSYIRNPLKHSLKLNKIKETENNEVEKSSFKTFSASYPIRTYI